MDRCALFVDAGYLLADGATAVHGTPHREAVAWDFPALMQLLTTLSRDRTGLPLLRCYWYESALEGRRTAEHDVLADIPGLKLRLTRIRPNRREGVDAQVHRDLMTLARNNAICDAVVVSGDEDLAQVVSDAQDLGIRVTAMQIGGGSGWAASRVLRQECDDLIEITSAHLRPFAGVGAAAEPMAVRSKGQHAVSSGVGGGQQPRSNGLAPLPGPIGGQLTGPANSAANGTANGTASGPPNAPLNATQNASPTVSPASSPAFSPSLNPVLNTPINGQLTGSLTGPFNRPLLNNQSSPANGPLGGSANGSPNGASGGAANNQANNQGDGSSSNASGEPLNNSGGSPLNSAANLPDRVQPSGHARPAQSPLQSAFPTYSNYPPERQSTPALPPAPAAASTAPSAAPSVAPYTAPSTTGPVAAPIPTSAPVTPPQGPAQQAAQQPAQASAAPASGSAVTGPSGPSQPSQALQQYSTNTGSHPVPPFGPYTGPQPAPVVIHNPGTASLAEAVKAAHKEGHDFGESVARDAPALWLEAVLARKPRMPSDLEARLLQGSSLPIEFLLHDEVRHALRRGFWDALERARQ